MKRPSERRSPGLPPPRSRRAFEHAPGGWPQASGLGDRPIRALSAPGDGAGTISKRKVTGENTAAGPWAYNNSRWPGQRTNVRTYSGYRPQVGAGAGLTLGLCRVWGLFVDGVDVAGDNGVDLVADLGESGSEFTE